jgi:hypothetical protein
MLCLLLNKIRDKGKTDPAWNQGGVEERGRGWGIRGINGPNNV